MFSKRCIAASAVALTSLASFAAEQPTSLKVADPAAQVEQTTYTSVLSTYKPAADTAVSPDKLWREANAAVASEGMQAGTHSGHTAAPQGAAGHADHAMPAAVAKPDPHAGHASPGNQQGEVSHAGHQMPAKRPAPRAASGHSTAAGHAGHQVTPATRVDPHAAHQMAPAMKPGPHAGHQMPQQERATKAVRPASASDAKNATQHGQHQQHQDKEAKK
jgi:hypothetical protein